MNDTNDPELVVVPDPEALATEAAERIAATLAVAVAERGRAHWATTGGSAAPPIYRRLSARPLRSTIPWEAVHVWWGDDRYVPRDHPLSNVKPFNDIMLAIGDAEEGQVGMATGGAGGPVPLTLEHLHPFRTSEAIGGSRGASWCAAQLGDELRRAGLSESDGWPVFDLVVLGIGGDGHLLSVFPGSAALASNDLALAIPAPPHVEPRVERVTLNPAILRVARSLVVVVGGRRKAPIMADIFGPERDPSRWPAQLARREGATWIVDPAAAAKLPR